VCALGLGGCAGAEPVPIGSPTPRTSKPGAGEFPDEPRALLRYHSLRFGFSVPLPDGRAWKIDDHKTAALVAEHPPTSSTLSLQTWSEPEVMNRQKCEDRAKDLGLVHLKDPKTLEDHTTVGPGAYDSRVWVALETGGERGTALFGHVLLFGAFVRKCLFAHYVTFVRTPDDEPRLTSRLAVARIRILAGMEVVPFDEPPRIKGP
jgi:hypothetical protein